MTLEEIKELSELRLQSEQRLQVENARLRSYLQKLRSAFDDKQISGSIWYEGIAPIPLGQFIERALSNRL